MKLVSTQNLTLDGVVEVNDATGDRFGPAGGETDLSDLEASLQAMMANEDAQLYGRKTFEAMRGFWPRGIRPSEQARLDPWFYAR